MLAISQEQNTKPAIRETARDAAPIPPRNPGAYIATGITPPGTRETPETTANVHLRRPQYRKINRKRTFAVSAIPQNHPEMYHCDTHNTPKPIWKISLWHPQYREINRKNTIVVSTIPQNQPENCHCSTHYIPKPARTRVNGAARGAKNTKGKAVMKISGIETARMRNDARFLFFTEFSDLAVSEEPETYDNFVRTLNVIIAKYMASIHTKHKKKT
jgi:hypothetical protein